MITRRRFLQSGTAAATFVSGTYFSGRVYAQGSADIGVGKGADIEAMMQAAINAVGGFEKFISSGDRVIIKPNLSFASPPERVATTNPDTIRALMKLCFDAGAGHVLVVDHPLQNADIIGERSEVAKAVQETDNATLMLLTTENLYREVSIPDGKSVTTTQTARILDQADVLISLPVAKSHSATGVSLGIKGNLGLVYDRIAYHNSDDFNQSLADLATIIKPDLTIIDAVRALTTRGPQGPGKVAELNTIVAGTDPVAVDSYAVSLTPWYNREIMGTNVPHLVNAAKMGLGEVDISKVSVDVREV